jgi:hypothetical protein
VKGQSTAVTSSAEPTGRLIVESSLIEWAAHEAERLLKPLGARWTHTLAVASAARDVAARVAGIDGHVLVAAAFAHDLGYAPVLHVTGHHGIDGAYYLRSLGHERLASLVAHHSGADAEAAVRGLRRELAAFPPEHPPLADALTFCDVTTGPEGCTVGLHARVADVALRYGEDHPVTRAVRRAFPALQVAVIRTELRLTAGATGQAMTG